jgi:hypothetical protein
LLKILVDAKSSHGGAVGSNVRCFARLFHFYCIPARACRAIRIDDLNHHSVSSDISRFRHIENNFSVRGTAVAFGARIGRRILSGATAVTPDGEPIAYEAARQDQRS